MKKILSKLLIISLFAVPVSLVSPSPALSGPFDFDFPDIPDFPDDFCLPDLTCDDGNPCTRECRFLFAGNCHYEALPLDGTCTDDKLCTLDCRPDPNGPCQHGPFCDDHDACTDNKCEVPGGQEVFQPDCSYPPVEVDDINVCTDDSCDPVTGPSHTPIAGIDDGDACTANNCDPATGPSHPPLAEIDDGIACTTDRCDPPTGTITHDPTPECCGNGTLEPGEACDDGDTIDGPNCTSICTIPPCGNGDPNDPGEECDDGNAENGDGCNSRCKNEVCGNGVVDFGEQCDDGNIVETDTCANNCRPPPPPPTVSCTCDSPGNTVKVGQKDVIFAVDKKGKPTLVTLACVVEPPAVLLESDKAQSVNNFLNSIDEFVIVQTAGRTVPFEGAGLVSGPTLVIKGSQMPGLPPLTAQYKALIPDAPKSGIEIDTFNLIGKDIGGNEKFKRSVDCIVGLSAFGGGGGKGGGCNLVSP